MDYKGDRGDFALCRLEGFCQKKTHFLLKIWPHSLFKILSQSTKSDFVGGDIVQNPNVIQIGESLCQAGPLGGKDRSLSPMMCSSAKRKERQVSKNQKTMLASLPGKHYSNLPVMLAKKSGNRKPWFFSASKSNVCLVSEIPHDGLCIHAKSGWYLWYITAIFFGFSAKF